MSTDATERPSPSEVGSRSSGIVDALLARGFLDPAHAVDARAVVDAALAGQQPAPGPLRRRLAEVVGYAGGVLVLSAGVVFVSSTWQSLSTLSRVGLLVLVAVILWTAALALLRSAGGVQPLRAAAQSGRRRLASVLLCAGALSAGAGAAEATAQADTQGSAVLLVAALVIGGLGVGGYLLAPSAAGQVVIAGATTAFLGAVVDLMTSPFSAVLFAVILLALGLAWLAAAERQRWHEVWVGRVLGSVLLVVGPQVALVSEHRWVAYLLAVAVAAAGFVLYLRRQAWPYVALGVASMTLGVTEAMVDWTGNSLGAAGGLLVAGATLLAASVLGLRLRRAVED